jgi:hypothetical protein
MQNEEGNHWFVKEMSEELFAELARCSREISRMLSGDRKNDHQCIADVIRDTDVVFGAVLNPDSKCGAGLVVIKGWDRLVCFTKVDQVFGLSACAIPFTDLDTALYWHRRFSGKPS